MKPNLVTTAAVLSMFGLPAAEPVTIHPADGGFVPGRVVAFNASQFTANAPSEFLTNYAIRYTDPNEQALEKLQLFMAPEVSAGNAHYVQYAVYGYGDSFLTLDNLADDVRAVGADFTTMRNTGKTMVTQRLVNRGLAVEVDEDEELLDSDWQQRKIAWLIGILSRSRLRRTVALHVGSAPNVNKTWDTTAGKDPDMDVLNELETQTLRSNRALIGPGAWVKRQIAHRAQNSAGGFASATLMEEQWASQMGLESAQVVRNRYATGASSSSPIIGSYVLLFSAADNLGRDDYSTMKTFRAPTRTGQRRAVYVRQIGDKRWRIAVDEGYELVAVTSTIGNETITVS